MFLAPHVQPQQQPPDRVLQLQYQRVCLPRSEALHGPRLKIGIIPSQGVKVLYNAQPCSLAALLL